MEGGNRTKRHGNADVDGPRVLQELHWWLLLQPTDHPRGPIAKSPRKPAIKICVLVVSDGPVPPSAL